MAHFAKLNDNNVVVQVIVADQETINSGALGDPSYFIKTSYNHRIRGKFAGKGDVYDPATDTFEPPRETKIRALKSKIKKLKGTKDKKLKAELKEAELMLATLELSFNQPEDLP